MIFQKTARLETLDIEFPLQFLDYFHNDGMVDSIDSYMQGVDDRYKAGGKIYTIFSRHNHKPVEGIVFSVPERFFIFHYHLAHTPTHNPVLDQYTNGQLETSFLDQYGRIDLLEEKLKKREKDMSLAFIEDRKVVESLGGIYSLDVVGMLRQAYTLFEQEKFAGAARKAYNLYITDDLVGVSLNLVKKDVQDIEEEELVGAGR